MLEPAGDEHAFFQIAATLIPLLLFGGVLIDSAKPPSAADWKSWHESVVFALVFFGAAALGAEALAIEAVVTGEAGELTRIVVAFVLVGAMTAVIAAISFPWLSRLKRSNLVSFRWMAPVSVMVLAIASMVALGILVDGTNLAARKAAFDAYEKALAENSAEQNAVRRDLDSLHREWSRLNGRLLIATGHGDDVAVKALTGEIEILEVRVESAEDRESFLFRDAANLEKEALREEVLVGPSKD